MLDRFLDYYRADFVDRAWGLDGEQLNAHHGPTTLTLARLIGHMTAVEYGWFTDVLDGDPLPQMYLDMDWQADPDAEMTRAETLSADQLRDEFEAVVAESHRRAGAHELDDLSVKPSKSGESWSLRWILIHMIEEYARHCGHADLIRESIDGDLAR